jgi:hypothetical protein
MTVIVNGIRYVDGLRTPEGPVPPPPAVVKKPRPAPKVIIVVKGD